jgi:hypothetical protein
MPFQFRKEAIEEDLNTNFPSQGQGNPPLYYSLSEVVVPTYSINNVAEGTILPENLQTAWDFSTGANEIANTTTTIISNPGFWLIDLTFDAQVDTSTQRFGRISLTDGLSSKNIWAVKTTGTTSGNTNIVAFDEKFVVYVDSGISVTATTGPEAVMNVWYRQIATINGIQVNPLGFSAA